MGSNKRHYDLKSQVMTSWYHSLRFTDLICTELPSSKIVDEYGEVCNLSLKGYEMFRKLFVVDYVCAILSVNLLESNCFAFSLIWHAGDDLLVGAGMCLSS